jgi:Domain of unknown function (DUF4345)
MKRGLQIVLGVLSLVPLIVSTSGLILGTGRFLSDDLITPPFDSQYRYQMGYYISLTLLAWWIIPNIEKHVAPLRIICVSIFMGGVGRVISLFDVGRPPTLALVFIALELCFPLLLLWQAQIRKAMT